MGKKNKRKQELKQKRLNGNSGKRMAIMVGMPIHHYMDNFTGMCMDATVAHLQKRGIVFQRVSVLGMPDVAKARNETVDEFLKDKRYTHLMWIDSDMAWDPSAVDALIDLNVPVASCLVTKKGPPFDVTLFQLMRPEKDSSFLNTYVLPLGKYPLDRPFTFPNSGIGTAFMLIAREVIEKMEQPYFCSFVNPADRKLKGTDFYFCVQMIKHGYEIVYDPRPRIYHIGKCLFGLEDHIAFLIQKEKEGIEECQFTSSGASVVEWKKSFAGPHPSLIQDIVPAAVSQKESSRHREVSKSAIRSWSSSEKEGRTSPPMKTGIDASKSKPDSEPTSPPPPHKSEPTKTMLGVEP